MKASKSNDSTLVAGLRFAGVGVGFVTEAGIVTALGWWLDGRFDTAPWLLVVGALLGVTLATISLVKGVERLEKMANRREPERPGEE